jgi:hypothetical protein
MVPHPGCEDIASCPFVAMNHQKPVRTVTVFQNPDGNSRQLCMARRKQRGQKSENYCPPI